MSKLSDYAAGLASTDGFTKVGFRPERSEVAAEVSDESWRQLKLRGGNVTVSGPGGLMFCMPRVSKGNYSDILFLTGKSYSSEMALLLGKFCKPGSKQWAEYTALRTAKRTPRDDGRGDYRMAPNLEPLAPPPSEVVFTKAKTTAKFKQYTLAQLFCDSFLQDKYDISAKFRRDMQLVAVSSPDDAAATYQDYLQKKSPGLKIRVSACGYKRTAHGAAAAIKSLAVTIPRASAAVGAEVIGDELFIKGVDSVGNWCVKGPLKHAESISYVYNLACHGGKRETIFLFGDETQVLGIDIFEGTLCISPSIIGHARSPTDDDLPATSSEETVAEMTDFARDRMLRVLGNVRPIMSSVGTVVASAVRMDSRMALINNHVLQYEANATLDGDKLSGSVPISGDLWMQRSEGSCESWEIGQAKQGDRVAILYHNGTEPVLSKPFEVIRVDGVMITSNRDSGVVVGMSGGALVSLRDFSLLGIHTGMMTRVLLASAITEQLKVDLVDIIDSENSCKLQSSSVAEEVMSNLRNRGLHKELLLTLQRLVPLHDESGNHVGTSVKVSGKLVTSCPTRQYHVDGAPVDFRLPDGFFTFGEHPISASAGRLPLVRTPQLHERVCIVVSTVDGPYFTAETEIRQVSAGGKCFFLGPTTGNKFSLMGGLVVSTSDGAVLGSFCRDTTVQSSSVMSMCAVVPAVQVAPVDKVEVLSKAFPLLHVGSWDTELLAEACTHRSVSPVGGNLALALRGDVRLKVMLYDNLHEAGVAHSLWNSYSQRLQSNARMSAIVWTMGIAKVLEVQKGIEFSPDNKAYADLLEALCCVAALQEETTTVGLFFSALGLVPSVAELQRESLEGVDLRNHMMRRPSELGLVTYDVDGEEKLLTPVD